MIFFCSVHTSRQFSFVKWTLLRVVELFVYIWWQSFLEVMKISKVWKELLSYQLSLSIFYRVALLLLMVPLLPGILIIKKQIASGSLILTVTNSFQVSDQRFFLSHFDDRRLFPNKLLLLSLLYYWHGTELLCYSSNGCFNFMDVHEWSLFSPTLKSMTRF